MYDKYDITHSRPLVPHNPRIKPGDDTDRNLHRPLPKRTRCCLNKNDFHADPNKSRTSSLLTDGHEPGFVHSLEDDVGPDTKTTKLKLAHVQNFLTITRLRRAFRSIIYTSTRPHPSQFTLDLSCDRKEMLSWRQKIYISITHMTRLLP